MSTLSETRIFTWSGISLDLAFRQMLCNWAFTTCKLTEQFSGCKPVWPSITKNTVASKFCYQNGEWLLWPGKAVQPGCRNYRNLHFYFFEGRGRGVRKAFAVPPSFRAAPVDGKSPIVQQQIKAHESRQHAISHSCAYTHMALAKQHQGSFCLRHTQSQPCIHHVFEYHATKQGKVKRSRGKPGWQQQAIYFSTCKTEPPRKHNYSRSLRLLHQVQ